MSATNVFSPLDAQLAELRRQIGVLRALCYTGRPEEDPRMTARHEAAPAADPSPARVHVKRGDGLEVDVAGPTAFVTATLEHVLTVLGVIQAPPPA